MFEVEIHQVEKKTPPVKICVFFLQNSLECCHTTFQYGARERQLVVMCYKHGSERLI